MKIRKDIALNLKLVFSSGQVKKLIKKFRSIIAIPPEGFHTHEEYENWKEHEKLVGDKGKEYTQNIELYKSELKHILGPLNLKNASIISITALLFSQPNFKRWKFLAKSFYFDLIVLKQRKELDEGIYIKINPFTNLTDTRHFISVNSEEIKKHQDYFLRKMDSKKFLLENDPMVSKHYDIYCMSLLTNQQLIDCWELDDQPYEYKEQLISRALRNEGYKITTDNIKKIIYRMNKNLEN